MHRIRIARCCGVENAQPWTQQNPQSRDIASPEYFGFEIHVRENSIDMVRGLEMDKSLGHVAGGENLMAPILNDGFGYFSNENIIFDDQDYCHFRNALRRECGRS